MKHTVLQYVIIVLLTLNSFLSYSQKNSKPICYLNSVKIEWKNICLNPKNIDSFRLGNKTKNGEIYICTKNRKINFLSLDDILKKYSNVGSSSGTVLFRINGKIMDDLSDIRVDDTYFIYVETKKLSESQYLNAKLRELVIVDISLESVKRVPEFFIRGKNELIPPEMMNLMKK